MNCSSLILTLILLIPLSLSSAVDVDPAAKKTWEKIMMNTRMPPSLVHATMKLGDVDVSTNGKWADSKLREMNILPYEGSEECKIDRGHGRHHPPPDELYLLRRNLTAGAVLAVHLRAPNEGLPTKFSNQLATARNMPPFDTSSVEENLGFFSTSAESLAGVIMRYTHDQCKKFDPINGRWQHCATSLEDLLSSVCGRLTCSRVKAVSTLSSNKGKIPYVVEDVKALATDKSSVLCHQLGFPYAVYYCHQPAATTTYSIKLKGLGFEDGAKEEEAFVVCHDDTSNWNPQHLGLRTMGVKPGTPLCHYLQFHDTVFYQG